MTRQPFYRKNQVFVVDTEPEVTQIAPTHRQEEKLRISEEDVYKTINNLIHREISRPGYY